MKFTQAQLRDATGISTETYRHWRTVLPPLNDHKGRRAQFVFGDLVAIAIIRRIVEALGVSVGCVAPASMELLTACRGELWLAPRRRYAAFSLPFQSTETGDGIEHTMPLCGALINDSDLINIVATGAIVIPVEPIVTALRSKLFASDIGGARTQRPLPFGPTQLTG